MTAPSPVLSPAVGQVLRLHYPEDGYRCRAEVVAVWPDGAVEVRVVSEDETTEGAGSEWTISARSLTSGDVEWEEST